MQRVHAVHALPFRCGMPFSHCIVTGLTFSSARYSPQIGVGNQPPALDSLTIAMVSRLQGQGIPSNTLLGEGSSAGTELAQRLAKKTGCVVFVSLNVPSEILECVSTPSLVVFSARWRQPFVGGARRSCGFAYVLGREDFWSVAHVWAASHPSIDVTIVRGQLGYLFV